MSECQVESVVSTVEVLLSDATRVQTQCQERSAKLAVAAAHLREEVEELRAQCEATQLDMARMRRQLEELMDSKVAYEAQERQRRKLSRQF